MKKVGLFLTLVTFTFISCQKEEGCDTNANLNGDCFNLDATLIVQNTFGQDGYTRERFQFIYQYPPSGPQERVRFVINADDAPNGPGSAGGIPASYSYTFTKLDRENNLISGKIEFSYSNDFGSESFKSTFTNVEVSGAEF